MHLVFFPIDKTSGQQISLFVFILIQMSGCIHVLLKMTNVVVTSEQKVWANFVLRLIVAHNVTI